MSAMNCTTPDHVLLAAPIGLGPLHARALRRERPVGEVSEAQRPLPRAAGDDPVGRGMPRDSTLGMVHAASAPPRLALVCGSGGVKSVAALGVAQVLEDAGITPDLIAGCSAGAVFGALLAAGLPSPDCLQLARTLWSRDITGVRRRGALLDMALGSMLPSRGAGFGETFALRDDRLIWERLRQAFGAQRIEDLPVALTVNATDALTGESVLLNGGSLCDALRASVALPFLFAPHRVEGRLLVDGSVSDPLPVAAAAHAEVVLAIGFEVPTPHRVTGPTRLATRVTAALTNNLMHARLASHAAPTRITLLPALDRRVGLFDTHAMPYLVELGRQAARQALPRLEHLLASRGTGAAVHALRHRRA
jgi:NTE family protein